MSSSGIHQKAPYQIFLTCSLCPSCTSLRDSRPAGQIWKKSPPVSTPDTAKDATMVPSPAHDLADIEGEDEEFDSNVPSASVTIVLESFSVSNCTRDQFPCRQYGEDQYRALSLPEREILYRVLERTLRRAFQLIMPNNWALLYTFFKKSRSRQ